MANKRIDEIPVIADRSSDMTDAALGTSLDSSGIPVSAQVLVPEAVIGSLQQAPGDIGVGTASPAHKLDIHGDVSFLYGGVRLVFDSNGGVFNIKTPILEGGSLKLSALGSSSHIGLNVGDGNAVSTFAFNRDGSNNGLFTITGASRASGSDATEYATETMSSTGLDFATGKGDITISPFSGKTGIGESSPNRRLEVSETSAGSYATALQTTNKSSSTGTASGVKMITSSDNTSAIGGAMYTNRVNSPNAGDTQIEFWNYSGSLQKRMTLKEDGKLNINNAYDLPNVDGTAGQVLTTDGANNVTFQTAGGGGASDINGLSDGYSDGSSVGLGSGSLVNDDGGNLNTAIGINALNSTVGGISLTAIGNNAGANLGTVYNGVWVGTSSGGSATVSSVSVGSYSGANNTGAYGTHIGTNSGQSHTSGADCTYVGHNSGSRDYTGISNTFIGSYAGYQTKDGDDNTAVGKYALYGLSGNSPFRNTVIGSGAGYALKTAGNNNTLIGYNAGNSIDSDGYNICIGAESDVSNAANSIVIGKSSTTSTSNALNIGDTIYATGLYGSGSVAIDETPVTDATLSVGGTHGAFLLPRLTTTQRDALTAIAGMVIWNTTTVQTEVHNGTSWGAM